MSVQAADDADQLPLDPDRRVELGRVVRVGGLEPDTVLLAEERLERDPVLLHLGHHDVPVAGRRLGADQHEVPVRDVALDYLALGLDPAKATFYRQSDIPEIPELTWLLTCVTGKGLLNRAHAYKASVDKNNLAGNDPDADVTAGLFMYPVLMGADILMFKAHKVPVGRDQIQHIEMARDIASRFNHLYGKGRELFVLPQAQVDEAVALLPGLDGRKMSKSYGNTIAMREEPEAVAQKIRKMPTDPQRVRLSEAGIQRQSALAEALSGLEVRLLAALAQAVLLAL